MADSTTTTTTSQTEIPQFIQDAAQRNIASAESLGGREYPLYPGQRIQPFSGDQNQAFDLARSGTGGYQSYLDSAGSLFGQAAQPFGAQFQPTGYNADQIGANQVGVQGFPGTDIQQYMDPFIGQVLERGLFEGDRNAEINRNQIGLDAASSGVFGGARHGVRESEFDRNYDRRRDDYITNLLSQAFGNAQNQFNVDRSTGLQADLANQGANLQAAGLNQGANARSDEFGRQLGLQGFLANSGQYNTDLSRVLQSGAQTAGLGQLGQQLGLTDINTLLGTGQQQQNIGQQNLDTAYQDFLRQFNYPIENLNLRNATLAGQPYPTSTTTTQTQPGPSTSSQVVGGLTGLLGLGSILDIF